MNLFWRLLLLQWRIRRAAPLDLWDTAHTPFQVVLTDLDLLRHMNNGKYLSILDVGRMDLLQRSGLWARLQAKGWYPVVAGQTITYRRSLKLGQRFVLATRILGFDDRWAYVEQTFRVGEVVYAQAIVRSRFLRTTGGSVEHHELEDLVGGFPAGQEIPEWMTQWTPRPASPADHRGPGRPRRTPRSQDQENPAPRTLQDASPASPDPHGPRTGMRSNP